MGKVVKESRVKKLLKLPIRFLVKARDFYVIGMSQLSDQMRYDAVASMGCPTHIRTLPRSFSVGTTSTTKSWPSSARGDLGNRITIQDSIKKPAEMKVARSQSIGLARIEEEEDMSECFSGEISYCITSATCGFPRSKSCAVSVSGGGGVLYGGTSGHLLKPAT